MMSTKTATLNGPGLVYVQFPVSPDLAHSAYDKRENDKIASYLLEKGLLSHASQWKCADVSQGDRYLMLYQVVDLAAFNAKFHSLSTSDDLLPTTTSRENKRVASIEAYATFYSLAETVGKHEDGEGDAHRLTHIITAGMQPQTSESSAELDRWYREEHNEQMSKEPGWTRSRRYRLAKLDKKGGSPTKHDASAPEWMTIHEFGDGNRLSDQVEPLDPVTDWTRKIMGDMASIEAYVWKNALS
ncbi:hypothetical protein JX266_003420 [Neoarthrinium moseri]|nr:hypothetical protein JX266_003420 [Neoarthrinium moseri]